MDNPGFARQCRDDGTLVISTGDHLTIANATDFSLCLRQALASAATVEVEFAAGVEVDITTLQILCSACKTAATEGRRLSARGAGIEALRQLIVAAGSERPGPCRLNHNNPCIWFGGSH